VSKTHEEKVGGRIRVDFFKVDKRFWRVDLGRNWAMSSMSTHFDYVIYVDMKKVGN